MRINIRYVALGFTMALVSIQGPFPSAVRAQDMFGTGVLVGGDAVMVVKPAAARGPAGVYVYRETGDGLWEAGPPLRAGTGVESGEGLSGSLAWRSGTLFVGSGDPDGRLGFHWFGEQGAYHGSVPLSDATADARPETIDLGTVMRILQPPQRIITVGEDRAVVAMPGGPNVSGAGVYALVRDGADWLVAGTIDPPEGVADPRFGAAVAMTDDRLLIGSPGLDQRGAVVAYRWDDDTGAWVDGAVLADTTLGTGAGFGAAIALEGSVAVISAPGASEAAVYTLQDDAWTRTGELAPPGDEEAPAFGAAVALSGDEAWVGAPGAANRVGAVYRFTREGDDWTAAGRLPAVGGASGYAMGVSLSLGQNVGVVGAPFADGAAGKAAIYSRAANGEWSDPVWVDPGTNLETVADGEVTCEDGMAAGFECGDVDLLAFLSLETLGAGPGERVSDVWGWTDPTDGKEYALVGRTGGATIVDITDAAAPRMVGVVPANPSGARDLKVYADHLYFTGDGAGDHGLVVFDLARIREAGPEPETFRPDTVYDGISSAHNLVIDPEAGFAYPVGASGGGTTCGGGLHIVDIREPKNPTFAGCFTDTEGLIWQGRTHDAQCVVYRGPDESYQGRQICFVSNETALRIVDVTDKTNPVPLGVASYPGVAYVHQGWLSDDHRHFYLDDELDELVGTTDRTRTLVWDVTELEDPVMVGQVLGPDNATDHNLYVKGNRMYQANYQAGFRVLDISDPTAPVEVGHFDTTPYEGNPPGFVGAWTAYPFFESGTVVVSSMYEGLFLLRPVRRELIP